MLLLPRVVTKGGRNMYKLYMTQCVLAFLSLYVGLAHSFSWEIVICNGSRLEFYDINGSQTHTENVTSGAVRSIIYDPVHNRVLFSDLHNIFSFDIASKATESLVRNHRKLVISVAYDPATEVLFWSERFEHIYSISIKPGFKNTMEDENLVLSQHGIANIEVDSCRGFVYWISRATRNLQRARFNGSDIEVVIDHISTSHFKIDQQTQKIYWFDKTIDKNVTVTADTLYTGHMKYADLNGKNVRTIYTYPEYWSGRLTISKDLIYWQIRDSFWKIPKNPPRDMQPMFFMKHDGEYIHNIAANYNIEDLTREIPNCEALTNLLPNNTMTNVTSDVSLLCVCGTKVREESRCECAQGYSGERCDASVCHNYCLHGDCSASAEGQPKCRCYAGYSGERCEVYACQGHCLNSGVCSLNENSEPLCQCSGDYGGERCEVPVFLTKKKKIFKSMLRSIPNTDVTSVTEGKGVLSTSTSTPSTVF